MNAGTERQGVAADSRHAAGKLGSELQCGAELDTVGGRGMGRSNVFR